VDQASVIGTRRIGRTSSVLATTDIDVSDNWRPGGEDPAFTGQIAKKGESSMTKARLASTVLYLLVVLITVGMGIRFLTAGEYFVYHAQASGMGWSAVDPGLQIVFMALFKMCGAGFLTVSLCLLLMVIFPFAKHGRRWSVYAIP
jgi:hypothetical protein